MILRNSVVFTQLERRQMFTLPLALIMNITRLVQVWCEWKDTKQNSPCWEEVGPDVDRLVVHLEAAEDTVQCWAPWVTVSRDDAVLPEHLRSKQTIQVTGVKFSQSSKRKSWSSNFISKQRVCRTTVSFSYTTVLMMLGFWGQYEYLN